MMRGEFTRQLDNLEKKVKDLFSYVCAMASDIKTNDTTKKNENFDEKLNNAKIIYDDVLCLCNDIILRQQPVAFDLLFVNVSMNYAQDLKRIGEQLFAVARILQRMEQSIPFSCITKMQDVAMKMLFDCKDAFETRNKSKAEEVQKIDDLLDSLFHEAKVELENSYNKSESLDYMLLAKYYERIGDHCVNISKNTQKLLGSQVS